MISPKDRVREQCKQSPRAQTNLSKGNANWWLMGSPMVMAESALKNKHKRKKR